jgi:DMSO/TMAO reductase YedYZ molybdopterin-dependent catalytic subunit
MSEKVPVGDEKVRRALWVKDTTPFTVLSTCLEPPIESQAEFVTPNELFFVCNDASSARVNLSTYRLQVEGDAVERNLSLTYDELLGLPQRSILVYLECAGNQRNLFDKVLGRELGDIQWLLGGVGMAEWTGVPLHEVLNMAGVKPNAVDVNVKGLDSDATEGGVSRPMPIEKAMDPDTLLAFAMNGETLPPDHGFPLRAIVPGWVGANSVKWVGSITVSSKKMWVHRTTKQYVMKGSSWPAEQFAPADGGPITTQNVKSSLILPWPATLAAGPQVIRGLARSPYAKIATVEWSADGGSTWQRARVVEPVLKYAWVRFELDWDAPAGEHTLMTQAVDEEGNGQPESVPINERGYLFNMIYPHPVNVSE